MKKYRATDRFWIIANVILLIIIVALFRSLDPDSLFTSVYWR